MAYVVYIDNSGVKEAMFTALVNCWPVIVIPMIMAYIAGVFVWFLVSLICQTTLHAVPSLQKHGSGDGA